VKKGLIILVSLILCEALLPAFVDPLSVLEQMPAPEVNYEVAPKESYPASEPKSVDKDFSGPVMPAKKLSSALDGKKIIENLVEDGKTQIKRFAPVIEELSRPAEKVASQSQDVKTSIDKAKPGRKTEKKPKPRTRVKQTNIKENLETLAAMPLIASAQALVKNALEASNEEVAAKAEKGQKEEEKTKESSDPTTKTNENKAQKEEEKAPEEDEKETSEEGKNSWDSVLAKAKGLQKKENWKGIKKLFADNPEAGETKAGLEYMLEAELNATKPNSRHYKRYADQLLTKDRKNGLANYALALYYFNARRPNPAKASSHLAIALKAKNPPPGASKLYWTNLLKSSWKIILILIAAIIGGIDYLRKKKKKAKGEINALDGDEGRPQPEKDTKSAGKLGGIKAKLLEKLAPIMNKIKKKKPETPRNEPQTSEEDEEKKE
jgi:hypothetical protein